MPGLLETNLCEEIETPSGEVFSISKINFTFKEWKGIPIQNTYNNKAVINYDKQPLFAELAILRFFQKEGWDGVWVDSYRNKYRINLPEKTDPVEIPSKQKELLDAIRKMTGRRGGCWDVLIWKGSEIKFVESKRTKKDALQFNQLLWLEKSIEAGLRPDDFILAEWDITKE